MANRDEYDQEETTVLSRQAKSAEQLPAGLMLLKMENESMMAVARAAPRNNALIVKQLEELIQAYPAAAGESVYRKPVGSVTEGTCTKCGIRYELPYGVDPECPGCQNPGVKDKEKTMKFAEGLSIRAAESIRAIYGCNRLAVSTEKFGDDGSVRISATFVDYAGCNMTSDDAIVSPWYKQRGGGMTKTPEDRFLGVVVKAAKSKLVRDVILDAVPNIIKAAYREACERVMAGLLSPEEVEQKIIPHFKSIGLSVEHLEKMVGRPKALGWTNENKIHLKQIATALKNGETTVAAILRDLVDENPEAPKTGNGNAGAASGSVSGSDLTTRKPQAETAAESKPAGQGETKAEPAKTEPAKTETPAPAGETKAPEGDTAGQEATEAAGETREITQAEKDQIAAEEFADACKEKFAAEFDTIQKCKTGAALDKFFVALEKDTTVPEPEKKVIRGWGIRRRKAIQEKK